MSSQRNRMAAGALAVAAVLLVAADKDLGTGYELENVEVMDKSMRLVDARRYMIEFNDALGVQCRDCHDLRDFADDGKELKLVAREMMKMTRDLNAEWFPDRPEAVTCWTCHQGTRTPPHAAPEPVPTK
ncbi:MAG: c-type cytochrome [Gemmatimonadetes bacterium]|nr:c-type cytochrome [Gemmatimonadota bacterium]